MIRKAIASTILKKLEELGLNCKVRIYVGKGMMEVDQLQV